ncbi:hypothetical protein Ndes2437B_g03509 [Nannochloris sp. 'desiccata']
MDNMPGLGSGGLTAAGVGKGYNVGMDAQDLANKIPGKKSNTIEVDALDFTKIPACSADWGGRGCRVIGCREDIYSQRAVNLKYRLCKTHKSASALLIQGVPKRFCSQCSTFRQLADFNGRMRACMTCLRSRSASRSKRGFANTVSNPNHNGGTTCGGPAGGYFTEQQQLNAAALPYSAILEHAQIEAIMAGAALAEILQNNGNSEPVATAAAVETAAAARFAGTDHQHQNQQRQELATTVYPPLPRIVSSRSTTGAAGAVTASTYINPNSFQPSVSPATMTTGELLQQESAMAALLAATAAAATTGALVLAPAAILNARKECLSPYHGFLNGAEELGLSIQLRRQTESSQQQQPQQPPQFLMPSAFHSVVEAHHRSHPTAATTSTMTASTPTTQPSVIVAKGLELKQQRVLAELHLAKTNLELARVQEDIHRLR